MLKQHAIVRYSEWLVGTVFIFGTAVTAIPAIAQTVSRSAQQPLISQVNIPSDEGVPSELYHDVEGIVVSLSGNQVQLDLGNNQEETYMVPEGVQRRYRMAPGSQIVLTVRDTDNDVVDVSLPGQPALDQ